MGFSWVGVKNYMDKEREERLIEEERLAKRKDMIFQTLLPALAKRRSETKSLSKSYETDLAWLTSRVGDVEGADQILKAANLRPDQVGDLRKTILQAERETGRQIKGEDFINQVSIVGMNLDDPDFVRSYTQTGDPLEAAMRLINKEGDVTDEELIEAYSQIQARPPVAPVGFDVDPSIYKEDLSLDDAKKQAEVFESTVLTLAKRDMKKMSEGDVTEFNAFAERVENYGDDPNATIELTTLYFDKAKELLSQGDYPSLGNLEENPYIGLMANIGTPEKEVQFSGEVTPEIAARVPTLAPYVGQSITAYSDGTFEAINE